MKEDDLSIRATLAAFPEDDPKKHQRHDLLVEASLAAPPPHYLTRAKNSLRRARPFDLFIAILALTLFWTQIISPAAQRDIRTVVSLSREQSLS